MDIDQTTIQHAIQYLIDGNEAEAARVLRDCTLENWEIVDSWMDGSRHLEGLLLEVVCPRSAYDIVTTKHHPITKSIENAEYRERAACCSSQRDVFEGPQS